MLYSIMQWNIARCNSDLLTVLSTPADFSFLTLMEMDVVPTGGTGHRVRGLKS
jgi:hypothetical protein